MGVGKGVLQPSGWGQGEAELPFGSFGLEEGPGQSPPWAKAKVEAGLTHWLQST